MSRIKRVKSSIHSGAYNGTIITPFTRNEISFIFNLSFFFIAFTVRLCYTYLNKKVGLYMKLDVNPNWTYRQAAINVRTLKYRYEGILSSFSLWQTKEWADFISSTRDQFYALDLLEWQIDNLWNYMNGNFPYFYLIRSASRYK